MKYKHIRVIGTGSFGQAVLVQSKADRCLYVMKRVNVGEMSEKERKEALKEIEILRLLNHPNIISYHENFVSSDGFLNIVMDYADGGDLFKVIQSAKGEYFPEEQIMDWFIQIALGLKHVHDQSILHRDLKTQNIFITKNNIIKLGDFGIAKILNSGTDFAKTMIGTPYYLSPEMCEDKPYNQKSDIWALGCVLYELTTLKHAFDGQNLPALILKILRGIYPPIPDQYTDNLRFLIEAMLQSSPDDRPSLDEIITLPFIQEAIQTLIHRQSSEEEKRQEKARNKQTNAEWMAEREAELQRMSHALKGKDAQLPPQSQQQQQLPKKEVQEPVKRPITQSAVRQSTFQLNVTQTPKNPISIGNQPRVSKDIVSNKPRGVYKPPSILEAAFRMDSELQSKHDRIKQEREAKKAEKLRKQEQQREEARLRNERKKAEREKRLAVNERPNTSLEMNPPRKPANLRQKITTPQSNNSNNSDISVVVAKPRTALQRTQRPTNNDSELERQKQIEREQKRLERQQESERFRKELREARKRAKAAVDDSIVYSNPDNVVVEIKLPANMKHLLNNVPDSSSSNVDSSHITSTDNSLLLNDDSVLKAANDNAVNNSTEQKTTALPLRSRIAMERESRNRFISNARANNRQQISSEPEVQIFAPRSRSPVLKLRRESSELDSNDNDSNNAEETLAVEDKLKAMKLTEHDEDKQQQQQQVEEENDDKDEGNTPSIAAMLPPIDALARRQERVSQTPEKNMAIPSPLLSSTDKLLDDSAFTTMMPAKKRGANRSVLLDNNNDNNYSSALNDSVSLLNKDSSESNESNDCSDNESDSDSLDSAEENARVAEIEAHTNMLEKKLTKEAFSKMEAIWEQRNKQDLMDVLGRLQNMLLQNPTASTSNSLSQSGSESPSLPPPPPLTRPPEILTPIKEQNTSNSNAPSTPISPSFTDLSMTRKVDMAILQKIQATGVAPTKKEKLTYRIEALRQYCEEQLGSELFSKAYKYLRSVDKDADDSEIQSTLAAMFQQTRKPTSASPDTKNRIYSCIRHINQLIFCEDLFYG